MSEGLGDELLDPFGSSDSLGNDLLDSFHALPQDATGDGLLEPDFANVHSDDLSNPFEASPQAGDDDLLSPGFLDVHGDDLLSPDFE